MTWGLDTERDCKRCRGNCQEIWWERLKYIIAQGRSWTIKWSQRTIDNNWKCWSACWAHCDSWRIIESQLKSILTNQTRIVRIQSNFERVVNVSLNWGKHFWGIWCQRWRGKIQTNLRSYYTSRNSKNSCASKKVREIALVWIWTVHRSRTFYRNIKNGCSWLSQSGSFMCTEIPFVSESLASNVGIVWIKSNFVQIVRAKFL